MAIKKSDLYSSLWASCDELRGGMDASQYKDYVLILLFIKYVSDKYAGDPNALIDVPVGGGFADMVAAKGEKLEWRTSIVDLMKALDIDSSFAARKELAKELGYTGDSNDSASMNIWLHKQVMTKLAANGGKLPADIKH